MRTGILVLAIALAPACAAGPTATPPVQSPSTPTLHPGDLLEVTVWREEDLSGEFPVNEHGDVTLPLLGRIHVGNTPMPQLRDSLLSAYAAQLNNPSVTIVPLRRIYVLGEVNKPGVYSVDPTITLTGAVAMAEGATPEGDLSRIRIVRGSTVVLERPESGQRLYEMDVRSGDHIFVEERSIFVRNRGVFLSSILSVITSVLATYLVIEITN